MVDILVAGVELPLRVLNNPETPSRPLGHSRRPLGHREGAFLPGMRVSLPLKVTDSDGITSLDETWIHRVRIRSMAVLQVLNAVSGESMDITKAHTL